MPRREEHERSRGGLFEGEVVGDLDHGVLGRGQQLGVAAVDPVPEHREAAAEIVLAEEALLALTATGPGREQHAPAGLHPLAEVADRHYLAGDVAAEHVRHGELQPGNTCPHEQVEVVQRAGADADQHLIGADCRLGGVLVHEHFRSAMLMNASNFHMALIV